MGLATLILPEHKAYRLYGFVSRMNGCVRGAQLDPVGVAVVGVLFSWWACTSEPLVERDYPQGWPPHMVATARRPDPGSAGAGVSPAARQDRAAVAVALGTRPHRTRGESTCRTHGAGGAHVSIHQSDGPERAEGTGQHIRGKHRARRLQPRAAPRLRLIRAVLHAPSMSGTRAWIVTPSTCGRGESSCGRRDLRTQVPTSEAPNRSLGGP